MLQVKVKKEDVTKAEERAFGSYVHGVLELFLSRQLSLEEAINRYSLSIPYWLRDEYRDELAMLFSRVKETQAFRQFLSLLEGGTVFTEKEILGPKGQRFRLDVLIKKDKELHVLDYKLGRESQEHISQLRVYCDILSLHFPGDICGWLFYLRPEDSELKRVI